MITQTYNIDLIPSGVPTIVHVSQYDSASRTIAMSIYDGGVAYDLTDKTVTVRGTKQDNTGFEYPCTVDGNVASFVLNAQMTIFSGDVPCEIRIAENGFVIGSHNFVLRVERTPLDSSIVISDTELPLIEGAEQNAIRAEQAADEAEALLSTVVKSVNSVTPDAQGNVDIDASDIAYDNTSSGLPATDVQSAIDEVSALGSTTLPIMDGTASAGTEQTYARGDHVHPTDTSLVKKSEWLDMVYPVGSVYISVNNVNPGTIFGGTWEQFAKARTLVGIGAVEANSDGLYGNVEDNEVVYGTLEYKRGEYYHTLTEAEMPAHNHKFAYSDTSATSSSNMLSVSTTGDTNKWRTTMSDLILGKGGSQAHNNMMPFQTVAIWKRTA